MNFHSCDFGQANRLDYSCEDEKIYFEKRRIIHVILVKKGVDVDESSAAAFAVDVLAAELAGEAKVIRNVSGEKGSPSVTEGEPRGRQARRVLGKTHTITFTDYDYVGNEPFWNGLTPDQQSNDYNMYYLTDKRAWPVKDVDISLDADDAFDKDNTQRISANITATWTQDGNPVSFVANTKAFDERQRLFDISSMSFVNDTGSTANITGGNVIEEDSGDPFEVQVDTNIALSKVEILSGSLPTGVVAVIDSLDNTLLKITGTSVQVGTKKAVLKASNEYGIYTEVPVTITIAA